MTKKIVLFNPQVAEINRKKGVLPLALLAISSKLAKDGYEIRIFDGTLDKFDQECLNGALCFGISAMIGYQVHSALQVAELVRKIDPYLPIIWGGWHPSIQPEQTAESCYVDFVVRGQGEIVFYELVKAIENGGGYGHIAGLTYKKNGETVSNPDAPLINPNDLPAMPYHLIDMEKYISPSEFGKRSVNYLSSIGCPHHCGFCAEPLVHKRKWMALTAERVVNDLEELVNKFGIDSVLINDSEFFINETRTAAICRGILKKKLNLKWGNANGRADTLLHYSNTTWELMRDSGLCCILVGAETSNEEILRLIDKGTTINDTIKFTKRAKKYSILIKFSLMIGLPVANRDNTLKNEFYKTIDFINMLYKINEDNMFLLFLYTPFPGTPLFEKSIKLGYKAPESLEEWGTFLTGLNHVSTPWIDKETADLVYQVNFYFPFVSKFVKRLLAPYPIYMRLLLIPAERILRILMAFRLQKKFFKFPVEYFLLKNILKITHK